MKTRMCSCQEIDTICQDLENEKVVGFPTETVYGLAIVSNSEKAFNQLMELKHRPITKPLSVMVANVDEIKKIAYVNAQQEKIIRHFMPGPLTILLKAKPNLPYFMTLGQETIGIRIPNHPLSLSILKKMKQPLLVTSANLSNEKALLLAEDVYKTFNPQLVSMIKEDSEGQMASTVVDLTSNDLKILRQGPISKEQLLPIWEENKMIKLAIGSDHGGYELKQAIIESLNTQFEFIDCGTFDGQTSCDYPDFAIKAASKVADHTCDYGIVICKSGIGVSIAANKVKGIRCALVSDVQTTILTKQHNNANMLAFGANKVSLDLAVEMIQSWLSTSFMGDRHQKRIDKITEYELNQK